MKSRLFVLSFLAGAAAFGQTSSPGVNECMKHRHFGRLEQAQSCFARLVQGNNSWVRAEGLWGIERFKEANDMFRMAAAQDPKNPEIKVRWGRLFLERWTSPEALNLFGEVLAENEKYAPAMLGMALAAAENFDRKAIEMAEAALKADPKLLEAQELLARLALEDGNAQRASEEADKAIKMSPDALDAMAVKAAIEVLADRKGDEWFDRILKINPGYGEAYSKVGHLLVINRRYEEAIAMFRKAAEKDPTLWHARSELGITYMRLGREKQAREELEQCYENGYKDWATVNTLRLMDSYKNFVTYETSNTILRVHKKEAQLLRLYFEPELQRAIATYEKKYQLKLNVPVQLEVYPDHEDFAVRTTGMPGLGALGVTFGTVVAMDSPSGRKEGTFHWASTLWHELSHVYVLTATKHRTPRWFTEGVAVHEETATSPDWGDRLDPHILAAIRDKKLLPIRELDRGFIRPSYPQQVIVSYFQAGRICDYIVEKWGWDKLLTMMQAFSRVTTTPEVVEKELGMKPEEFDKQFLEWLDKQVGKQVAAFPDWQKRLKKVAEAGKAKNWDEVIAEGTAIRDLYPDYVEAGSVYESLAEAYEAKGDKAAGMRELERYAKIGGRYPATLKKLSKLQEELGKKAEAAQTLEKLNFIYPVNDEEMHRRLGDLYLALNQPNRSVREYKAVLASKPIDVAAAHYHLAQAYRLTNRLDEAKEEVVSSLEAAPGYRPAQKLLLELSTQSPSQPVGKK